MALPHLHSCGVLWLLKVKHPTATMPLRIPVNFPRSSAYLIKIKVHNTRPWYLHHPYRISRGPCVPSFSLPDTLGRSFLNWKLHLQQGQLPRPLSPASCYLSKASPKQPQLLGKLPLRSSLASLVESHQQLLRPLLFSSKNCHSFATPMSRISGCIYTHGV